MAAASNRLGDYHLLISYFEEPFPPYLLHRRICLSVLWPHVVPLGIWVFVVVAKYIQYYQNAHSPTFCVVVVADFWRSIAFCCQILAGADSSAFCGRRVGGGVAPSIATGAATFDPVPEPRRPLNASNSSCDTVPT